jgi:hypothetical protein
MFINEKGKVLYFVTNYFMNGVDWISRFLNERFFRAVIPCLTAWKFAIQIMRICDSGGAMVNVNGARGRVDHWNDCGDALFPVETRY